MKSNFLFRGIISVLFVIAGLSGAAHSGFAQDAPAERKIGLPADIRKMTDTDSMELLNDLTIKMRLKKLLGKKDYAAFLESFETLTPVEKKGTFLFSSGCLIHACGYLESAIAIDLINNTIHAAIYDEEKETRFFNEKGSKTPKSITDWANRLINLKAECRKFVPNEKV